MTALLRAEWTKLRTLRSTWVCAGLAIGLTVLIAYLAGTGSSTDANRSGSREMFSVHLVHQTLSGDGSIVARVVSQEETGPEAKAGLMLTSSTERPSYAAVMVTPEHGVEWQADFVESRGSSKSTWLKLTRAGNVLTGFESADGSTWTEVGSATLDLPPDAMVGMFSTSPPTGLKAVRRSPTATELSPDFNLSTAVFDSVSVVGASGPWQSIDTAGPHRELPDSRVEGSYTEDDGTFTISGAGDLGVPAPGEMGDDDTVRDSLSGVMVGFMALAVLAVLAITAEYRRRIIRTTFTATPQRGRVLAARAIVVGAFAFVVGVSAAVPAFLVAQPLLRANGYAPPAYPDVSLLDGPVLRAVLGTGLMLALLAVLALALGALLRSSAVAITLIVTLVLLPLLVGPFLTLEGEAWLKRITPGAGLAIQQTRERWDDVIAPWGGIGVLCLWVAVFLAAATVQLRRRDA